MTSPRVTCHRFEAADDVAAARIAHARRPDWLTERGWARLPRGEWTHPSSRAVFTEAAAVRQQLRDERTAR
jgi:hypothetical protein